MADRALSLSTRRSNRRSTGHSARRSARRSAGISAPVLARYRRAPWWVKVVIIWVASRVITTSLLLLFASWQQANYWTGPRPSYLAFAQLWDGTWYRIVAESGYPSLLPTNATGQVTENAWAFMPVYPMFVRFIMLVSGQPWESASVAVSVAFSLASALMLYRLMRLRVPAGTAMFSVVLFCVAPLSPILQVAYAEPMYIFFLTLALYLWLERRYSLLVPVIAVMALTRPSGLAFALALSMHAAYRWFTRARKPYPPTERLVTVGLALFSGVMGLAWPAIAWAATGSIRAYTDTELAWRAPYVGLTELQPFVAWIQGARFWGGLWNIEALAIPLLGALVLVFGLWLFHPALRRLGTEIRFWSAGYALYLLAVFFPQSSTFRLLMPLFPLLGAVAVPKSKAYRVSVVGVFIVGQFLWIYACWWVDGYDWTPP